MPARSWRSLEGLDGRLRLRYEGRTINAQKVTPTPAFLRNGQGDLATPLLSPAGAYHSNRRLAATLKSLDSTKEDEEDQAGMTSAASTASTPAAAPPHKPTFLQRGDLESQGKETSLRAIERELGIH